MEFTRRLFVAITIAALASSTGLSTAYAQAHYRFAVMPYGASNEYMKAWTDEIQHHPAVTDGTVSVTVLDGKFDSLVQANQIDNAIVQQYDAIIMVPFDLNASAAPINKAIEAGIPVIVSAATTSSPKYTASIIVNDQSGGEILGDYVGKRLADKGNVVILEGPIGFSAQLQRKAGIDAGLAKHPGIKVLATKSGNWNRDEGQSLTENWLSAYPGQINAVIAENDEMALGAVQALKSAGIDLATVPVVAIDGIPDAKAAVADGSMSLTLFKYAKAEGQGAVDLALRKLIGDGYKPQSDIWAELMKWNGGADKDYVVPWLQLTKDNVAQYMK